VAAEQDTLSDNFLSRTVHWRVASQHLLAHLHTLRTERLDVARALVDGTPHRVDALRATGVAYGFEVLPDMLGALERDVRAFGPLTSDAGVRQFLADCHARDDRLDAATQAFLALCQEVVARLARQFQWRVKKEKLERGEMDRLGRAAALRVRDSRKLLRKVDKSSILADPYTLVGRVRSRVALGVEGDRVLVEQSNAAALGAVDALRAKGVPGALGVAVDVATERATQEALEALTGRTLETVVGARSAEEEARRYALKVKDTKQVLDMVRPTLPQLLGQTLRGD
jgi:hypothetical protein